MDAEIAAIEAEQEAEYADYLEFHDRARQRGQKTCEEAMNEELIKTSSKEVVDVSSDDDNVEDSDFD